MPDEAQFLREVLLGREDAVIVCRLIGQISQTWDDLIDKDRTVSDSEVNAAFTAALIRLPAQPFYREHFLELQPVMRQAVIDWQTANAMEDGGDGHDLSLAFVLRNTLVSFTVHCAFLVGGHEHAVKAAPQIRRYFHDETLEQYIGGFHVHG